MWGSTPPPTRGHAQVFGHTTVLTACTPDLFLKAMFDSCFAQLTKPRIPTSLDFQVHQFNPGSCWLKKLIRQIKRKKFFSPPDKIQLNPTKWRPLHPHGTRCYWILIVFRFLKLHVSFSCSSFFPNKPLSLIQLF